MEVPTQPLNCHFPMVSGFGIIQWRRKWQPTPVFLPGESQGQRSLVGYSPWSRKESDTTKWLTHTHTHTHTQWFRIHCSVSSLQSLSHVRLFATPWIAASQASLSITNSRSLLKLMPIMSVMPSTHLIFCRPLLPPPSIFPRIKAFSSESVLHIRWSKYWSLESIVGWWLILNFLTYNE